MATTVKTGQLIIGSRAFANEEFIPGQYTSEGENVNPDITVENIPTGTKCLALIVDDPDSLTGTFDHWLIWNIRPMEMIIENTSPGIEGRNSFGKNKYQGPCPPEGSAHRYFFKVYALNSYLELPAGSDKKDVEKAISKHILAEGAIIGMFKKTKRTAF